MPAFDSIAHALIINGVVEDAERERALGHPVMARSLPDGVELLDGYHRTVLKAHLAVSRDSWWVEVWKLPGQGGAREAYGEQVVDIRLLGLASLIHVPSRDADWCVSLRREERMRSDMLRYRDLDLLRAVADPRDLYDEYHERLAVELMRLPEEKQWGMWGVGMRGGARARLVAEGRNAGVW